MSYTLPQIANAALYDLGVLTPGQWANDDLFQSVLVAANELLDALATERIFIYIGTGPYTVLSVFPDLTTAYTFAPGYFRLLRKNIGKFIAPMMKIHVKIEAPAIAQVEAEAADAIRLLRGVGPPNTV